MAGKMVLSEEEALELVAFLVTAARTQVDDAAEYGSLRLLTAAGRLAELIAERVSPCSWPRLGHAAATQPPGMPSRGPVTWQSLTQWERFPSTQPNT
jgi:uncharacterized protein DUF6092